MKVYLANALGFYPLLRPALDNIVSTLTDHGVVVVEPFAHCAVACDFTQPLEPQVAQVNMASIRECDVLVAVIDGAGPQVDDGIAWEMGYATGMNKRVIVLRTRDIEANPINLQLHGSGIDIVTSVGALLAVLDDPGQKALLVCWWL